MRWAVRWAQEGRAFVVAVLSARIWRDHTGWLGKYVTVHASWDLAGRADCYVSAVAV